MSESATIEMAKKSRELKEQGIDIISLSLGEPDFATPECIKEAGIQAINNNKTHYTPVPGIPELRKAIARKLKLENNVEYPYENIIVSNGAKHSLANVLMALVEKGDEVIVPAPYWVSYTELVKLAEGETKIIETTIENHFKIRPQQLEEAITEHTKVLIFNSPSNPTGMVYTHEELAALVEVLVKFPHLYIIADEIYEYIIYEGGHTSLASFEALKDRIIIVNGVSKGFAMTGWRIGYIAANKEIAKACEKLQGQYTSGPNSIAQWAALKAIDDPECSSKEKDIMHQAFLKRRNYMMQRLGNMKGIKTSLPNGAFYIFPNIEAFFGKSYHDCKITTDRDFAMYLLKEAHVAVVPGGAFGNDRCVRLSYAVSMDEIVQAMDRIEAALLKLK
jgi:aspartate aminotransferase